MTTTPATAQDWAAAAEVNLARMAAEESPDARAQYVQLAVAEALLAITATLQDLVAPLRGGAESKREHEQDGQPDGHRRQ